MTVGSTGMLLTLLLVLGGQILAGLETPLADSYRAAVYEHNVSFPRHRDVVPRLEALQLMEENLGKFDAQARQAAQQKAKIIVFPEYGVYGLGWTRQKLAPFLEYIPDPAGSPWNPCDNPNGLVSAVQTLLSCIAKNNSIYVVANIGSQQPCFSTDKSCPSDHVYQFNTNVVYDPRGIFIARYFKYNLDSEEMQYFDRPPVVNHTIFDTPFGRFATVCSNDILYKEPTLTLVKTMNITNLAMPAAWKEELPLMSAIEFHSAFAEGLLINVLAANLHVVDLGYYGSGLYWPTGTSINASYFYDDDPYSEGSLVVETLTPFIIPPDVWDPPQFTVNKRFASRRLVNNAEQSSLTHNIKINGDIYTAKVFKFGEAYSANVCQGSLCCDADFEGGDSGDLFAFGAFEGMHSGNNSYYLQSCALIKCAGRTVESCGQPTKHTSTGLDKMSMSGNFSYPYQFPEVFTVGNHPEIVTQIWYYQGSVIIDAGLYGYLLTVAIQAIDYNLQ